jgi:hypothetical protein
MTDQLKAEMVSYPISNRTREAPCETRRLRALEELAELKDAHDEVAYSKRFQELALNDYWFYLTEILGLYQFDPWFHGEEVVPFIESIANDSGMLLMPRGGGKSTIYTIPYPAWRMAHDALSCSVIVNAREDKAGKMTRATAAIVANNPMYALAFPYVRPSRKWGERGYYLDREAMGGEASRAERIDPALAAYGVGGNLTGSHLNGALICDDLINQDIAKYPNQVKAVEDFFKEAMTCVDPGSPVCVVGTRWTYYDYYQKIIDGEILGTNGKTFKVFKCGITRGDGSIVWPERTYIDLRGKERKVGYTQGFINAQKNNRGRLFSALYYNEPILDADRQFDVSMIKQHRALPFTTDGVRCLVVETNGQQGAALSYPLNQMKAQEGRVFKLEEVKQPPTQSKDDRIKGVLQHVIAAGNLSIREDLWKADRDGIGREIRDFDRGRKDCLDALCSVAMFAREPKQGENPQVVIALDAAYTTNKGSDFTAIIAGCRFQEVLWVLDLMHFQSDRVDVIVRKLFEMHDRWRKKSRAGHDRLRAITTGVATGQGNRGRRGAGRYGNDPVRFQAPWEQTVVEPETNEELFSDADSKDD